LTDSMQGKTAIVTGATSGIGRASVIDFARHGVNVVASGRRQERGDELVAETQELPGSVIFVKADITVAKDVEAIMSIAVSEFERIDYAFNNAGGLITTGRLHEYSEEQWDHYSDTFLKSVWRCMKHEIEHMLPNKSGVIINNASSAGLVGTAHGAYGAMKHGVVGLTKTATKQYPGEGIRFNAVCPGWIDTEMAAPLVADPAVQEFFYARQSMKRAGTPEEVAALVRWMCSDEAAFVSGVAWAIDGGLIA
jgi:NAD(P)-dependent dehydrogenase (short-subunit alcohol dehydrogenase family)